MERFRLPILVPIGAFLATVVVVFTVALLLLWVGDYRWNHETVGLFDFIQLAAGDYPLEEVHGGKHRWDLVLFDMAAPVIVALLIASAILVGASLAARAGKH
jgi:hypothetical protein